MKYKHLILILLLISCGTKRDEKGDLEKSKSVPVEQVKNDQVDNTQIENRSFIIKTANYKFQLG